MRGASHERNVLVWLIAIAIGSCGCGLSRWEESVHPAQTENEFYIEGRTWIEVDDLGVRIDSVNFTSGGGGGWDGWVHGGEIWYHDEWVNHEGRTKRDMRELARHEVCHISKGTNHMEWWCECMSGYLTVYCS